MPTPPDATDLQAYLGTIGMESWATDQVQDALDAELANQRKLCRIPADPPAPAEPAAWPADLADALRRRVARNLALRPLPLGVQAGAGDNIVRVGGWDIEVRRLEAPYRKLIVG